MLSAEEITKSYRTGEVVLEVLKGITLRVEKGECLVIAGPSGAGKSTLLHILGGLDPPQGGRVLIEGDDLYRLTARARARVRNREIGFVFQFFHLLPEFTAWENIVLPGLVERGNRPGSPRGLQERAAELLDLVGLAARRDHYPTQLSGGEQQRVAIARALMNRPGLLLADEPTGNLDSRTSRNLLDFLRRLNRETGQTIVIVSHDQEVREYAHRLLFIQDGVILDR